MILHRTAIGAVALIVVGLAMPMAPPRTQPTTIPTDRSVSSFPSRLAASTTCWRGSGPIKLPRTSGPSSSKIVGAAEA